MKKRWKNKLVLLLACLAGLFLFAGCSVGESLEEVLANRNLTAQVTYYSNGGTFDGSPNKKEMYYKDGDEVLNIQSKSNTLSGTAKIERAYHDFEGWYYAELSNGKPVFDEGETSPRPSEKKVTFPVKVKEGDHLYLVAKWTAHMKVRVKVLYYTDTNQPCEGVTMTVNGTTYNKGDEIKSFTYDNDEVKRPGTGAYYTPFASTKTEGFTFVDYYLDEACTKPLINAWPLEKADDQTTDAILYAKYIQGDWTVVRETRDILDTDREDNPIGMFGKVSAEMKYWVANDIQTGGLVVKPMENFAATVWGNGFTISGLKISELGVTSEKSLFGNIAATAVIKDLTLDDVNFTYTLTQSTTVYFSFTTIEEGATVENVTLRGILETRSNAGIIPTKRKYGNKAGSYTSDEQYESVTQGQEFTVIQTA